MVPFVFLFLFTFSAFSHAGLLYNYQELMMKDVEQMNQVVEGRIQESKKTKYGKIVPLKEGFQAVFSRPDHDGVLDKVITSLRSEIENLKGWEKTVTELTNEALNVLSNPRAFQPKVQVTYVVFLTNMINYFKPDLETESFGKKIILKISEKKIEITSSAKKELQLSTMKELISPSEYAKKILLGAIHESMHESTKEGSLE